MDARPHHHPLFAALTGALVLVAVAASVGACTQKEPTPTTGTGEGTAQTAAPPTAAADPATAASPPTANTGFGVPLSPNKCPSAVPGSTTSVKELPDGVEVTVIAPGGTPINDIRQRGVQIIAAQKDPATGAGSAADGLLKCPILVKDTVITETDVPGGAAFTVKPTKPAALAELKKEAKARAAAP